MAKVYISLSLLVASLSLSAVGCGSFGDTAPELPSRDVAELQIDIMAARGFLGGSDYERYVLTDDVLWRECGSVTPRASAARATGEAAPAAGDGVLPKDPNFQIAERRVERLSPDSESQVKKLSGQLLGLLETPTPKSFPPPESVFSLTGGGLVEFALSANGKTRRIVTSVDAVSDGETSELDIVRSIYSALRGVGPVMCDQATFYGIGRAESPRAEDEKF